MMTVCVCVCLGCSASGAHSLPLVLIDTLEPKRTATATKATQPTSGANPSGRTRASRMSSGRSGATLSSASACAFERRAAPKWTQATKLARSAHNTNKCLCNCARWPQWRRQPSARAPTLVLRATGPSAGQRGDTSARSLRAPLECVRRACSCADRLSHNESNNTDNNKRRSRQTRLSIRASAAYVSEPPGLANDSTSAR